MQYATPCPTLFDKRVGSLTSLSNHVTLKIQETGDRRHGLPWFIVLIREDLIVSPFEGVITKAEHHPQLFEDPEG